jgi:hypothetical protein
MQPVTTDPGRNGWRPRTKQSSDGAATGGASFVSRTEVAMKAHRLGTVLSCCLVFFAAVSSARGQELTFLPDSPEDGFPIQRGFEPCWTVRAGTIILQRSAPVSTVLVTNSLGTSALLTGGDFDFGFKVGPDVSLIHHGTIADVEFRFFRVDGWNAIGPTITSPAGAVVQFQTPFLAAGAATVSSHYRSELGSFEANLRRPINSWLTLLAGFRYVELNEGSLALGLDFGEGETANFNVTTCNALYGFQLGADAAFWNRGGRFRVEGTGRVGVYNNHVSNRSSLVQTDGDNHFAAAGTNHAAFVGELGFTAVYEFTPRLAARAGYELFWVQGAALASDQLAATRLAEGTAGIDASGSAFYHGAIVGLECSW